MQNRNRYFRALRLAVLTLCAACSLNTLEPALSESSPIHSDEEVVLFPTFSTVSGDGWTLPIHGWIFEPERNSIRRRLLLSALCRSLELTEVECDAEIFKYRARYFLVDNERGKHIRFQIGGRSAVANPSGKEGHFHGALNATAAEVLGWQTAESRDALTVSVSTGDNSIGADSTGTASDSIGSLPGERKFAGFVIPLQSTGLTVISDIDDTLKVSNVGNKKDLLRNTFTRPFSAVPQMAPLLQALAQRGAAFHYLSASPWQLYVPLEEFLSASGFPKGIFHLKEFRWADSRFFDLFNSPISYKTPILRELLAVFPRRHFLLLGDSGEKDPEIYADLSRQFPAHSIRILIREVAAAPMTQERCESAFRSLPPETWRTFTDSDVASAEKLDSLIDFAERVPPSNNSNRDQS